MFVYIHVEVYCLFQHHVKVLIVHRHRYFQENHLMEIQLQYHQEFQEDHFQIKLPLDCKFFFSSFFLNFYLIIFFSYYYLESKSRHIFLDMIRFYCIIILKVNHTQKKNTFPLLFNQNCFNCCKLNINSLKKSFIFF